MGHINLWKSILTLLGSVLIDLLLWFLAIRVTLGLDLALRSIIILVGLLNQSLLITCLLFWLLLKVVLLLRVNFGALLVLLTA